MNALRLADSDKPGMDQIVYLLHCSRKHLKKSKMDELLFPPNLALNSTDQADTVYGDKDEGSPQAEEDNTDKDDDLAMANFVDGSQE